MECHACHNELREGAVFCPACGEQRLGTREFTGYQYAAFISYRHGLKDTKAAREVQQFIETYRLPANVASRSSAVTAGADRLGKVFRDEDELAASASLPDRIFDALAASRALIVVCSRESAASMWVDREVQAYAEVHGRSRIFTVLLDGDSHDVLPQLLRTKRVVAPDGTVSEVPAEPLSVDMRAEGKPERRAAMLRLVAGLVGCSYDDLVQRDMQRKRKRRIQGGLAAAVVLALVACLGVFGFQQYREAQVNESLQLTTQSQQQFAAGDRYGAIESALAALPAPADGGNRPYVAEAQAALEEALEVHVFPDCVWRPAYTIECENTIGALDNGMITDAKKQPTGTSEISVNETSDWFAVSDDLGVVTTYEISTGRKLASWELPFEDMTNTAGHFVRRLFSYKDYLVISNLSGSTPGIACFNVRSGEMLWSHVGGALQNFVDAGDSGVFLAMEFYQGEGFAVAYIDVETGEVVMTQSFADVELPDLAQGTYAFGSGRHKSIFFGVGNKLVRCDLSASKTTETGLAFSELYSVRCEGDVVIATTLEPGRDDTLDRRYAVEAFDAKLQPLWSKSGTTASEMMRNADHYVYIENAPKICGFVKDSDEVVVSVGRRVAIYKVKTGKRTFSRRFNHSCVGLRSVSVLDQNYSILNAVCADGFFASVDLSGTSKLPDADNEMFDFPGNVRAAYFCILEKGACILALSSDVPNRIIAYHTDYTYGEEPDHDLTLNELVEQANKVLSAAGRR